MSTPPPSSPPPTHSPSDSPPSFGIFGSFASPRFPRTILVGLIAGQLSWEQNDSPMGEGGTSLNPFRTAVPFWGQTSQISSSFVPKRDRGSKGVKYSCDVYQVSYTWYMMHTQYRYDAMSEPYSSFLLTTIYRRCVCVCFFMVYLYHILRSMYVPL